VTGTVSGKGWAKPADVVAQILGSVKLHQEDTCGLAAERWEKWKGSRKSGDME